MSQVCLQFHNTKWIYNSVNELPSKTFCDLVKKVAAAIVAIFPILLALVIDVICDAYNYLSGNQKVEPIAPKTHETQTVSQPQSSKYEGSQVFAYKINDQELRREFDYFND